MLFRSNAVPFSINSNTNSISGGWLQEQFSSLKYSNIEIEILPFFPSNSNIKKIHNVTSHVIFKPVQNNTYSICRAKSFFKQKLIEYRPDLIHIHGTELPHCYAMSLAAIDLEIPYIVSLQGIVSEIYKHVLTGMDPETLYNKSIRDIIFGGSTIDLRILYKKLSVLEKKVVQKAEAVIGRTDWDKAWIKFYFDKKTYFASNEPLRKEFLYSKIGRAHV